MSGSPTEGTGAWRRLLPAIALGVFVAQVVRFDFLTDDAFISFCYSRNLAQGHGLRFDPVAEPVEGFSNFLWVVIGAAIQRLGGDPGPWSRAISAACGIALFVLFERVARRRAARTPKILAGTLFFLATLPPLAVWSTGGLATMPFALVVFATWERLLGNPERPHVAAAAIGAALAVLLRADGFVWVGLIVAAALTTRAVAGRPELLRGAVTVAAAGAAVFLAYLAFRVVTFGDWVPNTARVKVGLSWATLTRGMQYAASFLVTFPACALAFALAALHLGRPRCGLVASSLVVALGTFAYAALVGGDYLTMGRFLIPAVPFLGLLFGAGLSRLEGPTAVRRALVLGLVVFAAGSSLAAGFDRHVAPHALRAALHFRHPKPKEYRSEYMEWLGTTRVNARLQRLGRALAARTEPGESITQFAVGAVAYFSGLRVFDQWGLTDQDVWRRAERSAGSAGHDLGVTPDFFLDRRPTYFAAAVKRAGEVRTGAQVMWGQRVEVEAHSLSGVEGFEDDEVLQLVRVVYEP